LQTVGIGIQGGRLALARGAAAYNTRAAAVTKRMSGTRFSIAHLSDPHLTQPAPVSWRQLCNKRCLGLLSWRRRRCQHHQRDILDALVADLQARGPDHTVVTGDLTQIGLPAEFVQARAWLEALGDPAAVSVIPGNHDAYVRDNWSQTFAHWRDYLAADEAAGWSADAYPSLRVRGPVAIIGLNSAIPADWLRAVGRVGTPQRERLAEILHRLRHGGLFRLVLVHHAPVPGVDPWRKRMLDGRETSRVLSAGGVHLVLHGHDHRTRWSSIAGQAGDLPVVAVPSASYATDEPGKLARYHIYHLQRADSRWQVEVEIRGLRDGRFEALGRRELSVPAYD
jgi:3',5'-cyclic AMP phosphodiesterase CpdA